jgi:hypothetical protein
MVSDGDGAWRAFRAIRWAWGRGLALTEGLHALLRQRTVNTARAACRLRPAGLVTFGSADARADRSTMDVKTSEIRR